MMNKILIGIVIILIVVAAVVLGFRIFSGEDVWVCENGQWVRHGNPVAPMPTDPCDGEPNDIGREKGIVINNPKTNQEISSPLIITGEATGPWYFEANFNAELLDGDGDSLGMAILIAQDEWMTENFVPFKGRLNFIKPQTPTGILRFLSSNPSGLPEHQKQFDVPIKFSQAETITVKAFFNNNNLDPEVTCVKVFPVERHISKTEGVARAALEELLSGTTIEESTQGYLTSINSGVKIQSLTIIDGVARVDFDEQLEFQMGGSCRVSAIRAQIEETLKQFPTIEEVIISINGRTEDILQP